MFNTNTEIMTDNVTKIIVKSRYSPISGTTREVDGIISVMTRRKTRTIRVLIKLKRFILPVRVRRTEIQSVIFSPESEGR